MADHHIEIIRSANGRDWNHEGTVDFGDDSEQWCYISPQIYRKPAGPWSRPWRTPVGRAPDD